tara:strand:- start:1158 stop:2252 length:1095 start_codon:yes stop_codon:yes gene_type:complete
MDLNNPIGIKSSEPNQSPFIMNPYRFAGGGAVGGWKELDRNILTVANSSIDITGLPNRQYYMVIRHTLGQNTDITHNGGYQLNGDDEDHYAVRRGYIGNTTSEDTDFGDIDLWDTGNNNNFHVAYISNISGEEKLFFAHNNNQNTGGSSTAPYSVNIAGKWADTTEPIDQITLKTLSSNTWNVGSEVIVLGYDESDTHTDTDNFWQELASADLSSGTDDDLSSGTFTAKKYLCVQTYLEQDGGDIRGNVTFNDDPNATAGTLYSRSRSNNWATRSQAEDESSVDVRGGSSQNWYSTMYIANRSNKVKLINGNIVLSATGNSNHVDHTLFGAKWDSTAQITEINFHNTDGGSYGTNSIIKVWGHD